MPKKKISEYFVYKKIRQKETTDTWFHNFVSDVSSRRKIILTVNSLIFIFLGYIIFILLSGGVTLEYHIKIKIQDLIRPGVFLFLSIVMKFCLWWMDMGTGQSSETEDKAEEMVSLKLETNQPSATGDKDKRIVVPSRIFQPNNLLIFLLVVLTTAFICTRLYGTYSKQVNGTLMWDMAEHGIRGIKIAENIERFDINSTV